MNQEIHRRKFLEITAGGTAGMLLGGSLGAGGIGQRDARLGIVGVGGRGTHLLRLMLEHKGTQVPAVCDIRATRAERAAGIVEKARDKRPETYTRGPEDYRRMLRRDDLDAVLVTTPMQLHAVMSAAALRAGKHVLSEVAAAVTLDECWDLVRAVEETGRIYMLAENCCYYRECMMILEMLEQGLFGDLTYAECGYIHDCRRIWFQGDGTLTWRGELHRDLTGNLYPTHAIGPVAQWMGIHRGDRFVSLTAAANRSTAPRVYAAERFGADHPAAKIRWRCGDSTNVLIKTAKGALIEIRYDTASTRPHPSTTHYLLQGTRGAYLHDGRRIYIQGKTEKYAWESLDRYRKDYDHPMWRKWGEEARGAGHGGADFFTTRAFLDTLRAGTRPPIDVYDAVAWSSIIPLSAASIEAGGKEQPFPDFMKNAPGRGKL